MLLMKKLAIRASLCCGIRFEPGVGNRTSAICADAVLPFFHSIPGSVDIGQFGKLHIGERVRYVGLVAIVGFIRHADSRSKPDCLFLSVKTISKMRQLFFGKMGHILFPDCGIREIR